MSSNIEKYKKDLEELIELGGKLLFKMEMDYLPELSKRVDEILKKEKKKEIKEVFKKFKFEENYQIWYSESLVVIEQLLPDRLNEFIKLYEKPSKTRKNITHENYVIEDALQGIAIRHSFTNEVIVDQKSAITKFEQQLNILKSLKRRFESTLFDIKQLVQADIFDNELLCAEELNNKGFMRGAGAIAGVILEGHLSQVCKKHKIKINKKHPGINDLAQLLKDNKIIETPEWRNIQYLADVRNLCDHKKEKDPTKIEISKLIAGVSEVIKTIY